MSHKILAGATAYEIVEEARAPGGKAIKHLACGRTSYNPNDVNERYCGFCHVFLDDIGDKGEVISDSPENPLPHPVPRPENQS
jgi:hypothetical protein